MKSNRNLALAAWLHILFLIVAPCPAADTHVCEVAVAALSLPDESTGLVHWRTGDTATTPLQLSTRYFSERMKLKSNVIRFYQEPVPAGSAQEPAPEPLLTLRIPVGEKLVYIVMTQEQDGNLQNRWRGNLLNAKDWKVGSMKVFNACSEPIGITAGKKRIQLNQGKSVDFHAREWGGESFPVKIFRMRPELKTLFSSAWRVTEGRRELLFIGGVNGSVSLRSLMELAAVQPVAKP